MLRIYLIVGDLESKTVPLNVDSMHTSVGHLNVHEKVNAVYLGHVQGLVMIFYLQRLVNKR